MSSFHKKLVLAGVAAAGLGLLLAPLSHAPVGPLPGVSEPLDVVLHRHAWREIHVAD